MGGGLSTDNAITLLDICASAHTPKSHQKTLIRWRKMRCLVYGNDLFSSPTLFSQCLLIYMNAVGIQGKPTTQLLLCCITTKKDRFNFVDQKKHYINGKAVKNDVECSLDI